MIEIVSPEITTNGLRSDISTPTLVTPEMATEWLAKYAYERQRALKAVRVEFLAEVIADGTFETTPITFALCQEDDCIYLVDGQHRLNAIVKSETPAWLYVITRVVGTKAEVKDLYGRLDRGASRSTVDVLRSHDITNNDLQRFSAAYPFILDGFLARATSHIVSGDRKVQFVNEWIEEMTKYSALLSGTGIHRRGTPMVSAGVVAVVLVTLRFQPTKAEIFWREVAADDGLRKGTPAHTLLAWLRSASVQKLGRSRVPRGAALAWNAYFQGRPLSLIKVMDETGPIFIAGTPYKGR